jgi:hypothetical protein
VNESSPEKPKADAKNFPSLAELLERSRRLRIEAERVCLELQALDTLIAAAADKPRERR